MKEWLGKIRNKLNSALPVRTYLVLLAGVILLILIFLVLPRLLPNNNPADLHAYYGVGEGETIVFLNTDQVQTTLVTEEDTLYLPLDFVTAYLNQRFYADRESGKLLYVLPDRMDEFTPDKRSFSEGSVTVTAEAAPYIIREDIPYLSLEIVEQYTRLQSSRMKAPDRLCLWTRYDEDIVYRYAGKDVNLRTGAGYGHPVVCSETSGTALIQISEEAGWLKVYSRGGNIGYVPEKAMGDPVSIQTSGAFFQEQEYGTDQMEGKLSVGFDYIDDISYGLDMLRLHIMDKEAVNVMCPTWFTLEGDEGEFRSCADPAYVKLAHRNNMKVWALLENINAKSDGLKLFSSRKARENLIGNLLEAAEELDLDGINLDIESLTEEIVPHYLEFIRELSLALQDTGVVLSADTYAPYSWNLKYDLPELAKLLDYVIIMGYDQSWDVPGPNSDLDFITFCCEESLKVTPEEKLIIAVPFYTRGWAQKEDGTWSRMEINMKKCVEYLETCEDKEWLQDKGCYHGHVEIDGVMREVWFEEPESSEERIARVSTYNAAGLAYWRLSQEDTSVWDSVRLYGFYK